MTLVTSYKYTPDFCDRLLPVPINGKPSLGCWGGLKETLRHCKSSREVKDRMIQISEKNLFYFQPLGCREESRLYFARWTGNRKYNDSEAAQCVIYMIHIPKEFVPAFYSTDRRDQLKERVNQYCLITANFFNSCIWDKEDTSLLPPELDLNKCLIDEDGSRENYPPLFSFMCRQGNTRSVANLLNRRVDVTGRNTFYPYRMEIPPIGQTSCLTPRKRYTIISRILRASSSEGQRIDHHDLMDLLLDIIQENAERYYTFRQTNEHLPKTRGFLASLDPYFIPILVLFCKYGLRIEPNLHVLLHRPKRLLQLACESSHSDGKNKYVSPEQMWLIRHLILGGAESDIDPTALLSTFTSIFSKTSNIEGDIQGKVDGSVREAIDARNTLIVDWYVNGARKGYPPVDPFEKEKTRIAMIIARGYHNPILSEIAGAFEKPSKIVHTLKELDQKIQENLDLSDLIIAETIGKYVSEMRGYLKSTSSGVRRIKSTITSIEDGINTLFEVVKKRDLVIAKLNVGDLEELYSSEKELVRQIKREWCDLVVLAGRNRNAFNTAFYFADPTKVNLEPQEKQRAELNRERYRNLNALAEEIVSNMQFCIALLRKILTTKNQQLIDTIYQLAKRTHRVVFEGGITEILRLPFRSMFLNLDLYFRVSAEFIPSFRMPSKRSIEHLDQFVSRRPLNRVVTLIADYVGESKSFWSTVSAAGKIEFS